MAVDKKSINLEPLKSLVARVVRTFYDSREAIVTDYLLSIPTITYEQARLLRLLATDKGVRS